MHKSVYTPTLADAIRFLTIDAVQKANSGHPGTPMGMAEIAQALWLENLRHNPADPAWFNRDRFVLSNGHGSMLLYSLLYLTGYDLTIDQLREFRQLNSCTPGHPEIGITAGVEVTTGPLGQGLGNAIGMALAEALLAAQFNKPGHTIVDHYTYVFVGDGCMMEGVSHEVCSLAGTLKLSKLIVVYDDNGISIDGNVQQWFGDNTAKRFEGYGWNVIRSIDGHSVSEVSAAIHLAQSQHTGPTLIICRTVIGWGAPNIAGTAQAHGTPLGTKEVYATRAALKWPEEPFKIPPSVLEAWNCCTKGELLQKEWEHQFVIYTKCYPKEAEEFKRRMRGELPKDFDKKFCSFLKRIVRKTSHLATRKASQLVIEELATILPELLGGSADLTSSNLTSWEGVTSVRPSAGKGSIQLGRYINYGAREFGMATIMNGLALHGGYLPFGGTFLAFSDYSRNAIRMSALMKQRVVYVFTHDSIGLGEDGPTHQPIEHISSLRLIPNLSLWRPCDITETAIAWREAVKRPSDNLVSSHEQGGPTALLLSRQRVPSISRDAETLDAIARGGYILRSASNARAVIIATGSEVAIALNARKQLASEDINVCVVSMPSTDVFDRQSVIWKESVLPKGLPCIAIEAGVTTCWYKYVGKGGSVIGIDSYGKSAPSNALFNFFGLTTTRVAEAVKQAILEKEDIKNDNPCCY